MCSSLFNPSRLPRTREKGKRKGIREEKEREAKEKEKKGVGESPGEGTFCVLGQDDLRPGFS